MLTPAIPKPRDNLGNFTNTLTLTRDEALSIYYAIDRARIQLVMTVKKVGNMRSILNSEKAAEVRGLRADIERFEALAKQIGEAFAIGGH